MHKKYKFIINVAATEDTLHFWQKMFGFPPYPIDGRR
jgi:hypothetical protein